jgi:hypothetical protein
MLFNAINEGSIIIYQADNNGRQISLEAFCFF